MSLRFCIFVAVLAIAVPAGANGVPSVLLDTWNVDELQASDDYIGLEFGTYSGNTTLTLQWVAGADDTPGALGIDKFFINNIDQTLEVSAVFANSIVVANDLTSDWLPTNGGTNAGGGFGLFLEKVMEPAGNGGVAPASLIFVLNGLFDSTSFIANGNGAAFAAHVRYDNGCSGWVADGGTAGSSGSSSNCGGNAPVPEPSAALAFGAGALIVASATRRRR